MPLHAEDNNLLTLGLAQIAPTWLDRKRTHERVESFVVQAAEQECHLIVFGEVLAPGSHG
jgi:nitrilase